MDRSHDRPGLNTGVLVFAACLVTSLVGFALEPAPLSTVTVYLAPGVAFALLWHFGTGVWPAVALASSIAGLLRGSPAVLALLGGASDALMAILAYHALRACDFRGSLARTRDALSLILVTFGTVGIGVGLFGIGFAQVLPRFDLAWMLGGAWAGVSLGVLIAAPPILMWMSARGAGPAEGSVRPIETAALALLLIVACDASFGGALGNSPANYPLAFIPFPILLSIGLRIGPRTAVTATSFASIAAFYGTVNGVGPFAAQSPVASVALHWLFLGTMQVTFLILAAVLAERKAADDALVAEKERAERATRAKSEFLSVMNHELRTPLNSILLATDLILESELSEEQRDLGQTVMRAGEALRTLVGDTLDMARIEEGRLELLSAEFSPYDLSRGVVDVFADAAKRKNVELVERLDDGLPRTLRGDAARLRQVLINLVGNALKFTDEGRIVLRTECPIREAGTGRVRWEVTDSGAGITEEDCQSIFEPFTQVDGSSARSHGGSGLGLAISRRLVERMGGEIGVSSRIGRGSTFWLTVPLQTVESDETERIAEAGGRERLDAEDRPPQEKVA